MEGQGIEHQGEEYNSSRNSPGESRRLDMPHSTPHSDGSSSHRKSASSAALKSMLVSPRSPHVHLRMVTGHCLYKKVFKNDCILLHRIDRSILHLKDLIWLKEFQHMILYLPRPHEHKFFQWGLSKRPAIRMLLLWSACLHRQNPIIHQKGMGEAIDQYQGHLPEKLYTGSTQLVAPRRLSNSSVPTSNQSPVDNTILDRPQEDLGVALHHR